jgi:tetratricopeptide (TPR) repeat protein
MDSERRHELATNELAEWIVNFPKWFKENMTTVIIGVVVVIALIAYTIFFYNRENRVWDEKNAMITASIEQLNMQKQAVIQGKTKGMGVSDLFQTTANTLKNSAAETDNAVLSALAMVKQAEALRTDLHYRLTAAEPDVRKFQFQQAQKIYEEALAKAKSDPQVAAMAQYGIGLCLEEVGDFAGAKTAYEKLVNEPIYKGTTYQERAQVRVNTMSDNQRQVVFARAPISIMPPAEEVKRPGPLNLEGSVDVTKISAPKSDSNKPK